MRIFKYFVCVVSLILVVFALPISSHADNVVIYGCYQKLNGQLRYVNSIDQCLKSELPISWVAQSGQSFGPLTLYVNGASGLDQPGYGKSVNSPFKTISYALSQVPLLRNSEYRAIINVAAGTYNESIIISLGSISIIGADSENTEIRGTQTRPVVEVYSRGAVLSGLKITNGNIGIYAERATLTVDNCIIQNIKGIGGGQAGITVNYNTSLNITESQIHSNSLNGVSIYRGSSLVANNVSISDNGGNGIEVWYTALARVNNCQIERNSKDGITIWASSSLQLFYSTIKDNTQSGIGVTSVSSAQLRGGNVIQNNNIGETSWNAGIRISQGGEVSIFNDPNLSPAPPKDQIIDNYKNGIILSNNATIRADNSVIENNHGNGVDLNFASSGEFNNTVSISNNQGHGIVCSDAVLRNYASVSNNGLPDISCSNP